MPRSYIAANDQSELRAMVLAAKRDYVAAASYLAAKGAGRPAPLAELAAVTTPGMEGHYREMASHVGQATAEDLTAGVGGESTAHDLGVYPAVVSFANYNPFGTTGPYGFYGSATWCAYNTRSASAKTGSTAAGTQPFWEEQTVDVLAPPTSDGIPDASSWRFAGFSFKAVSRC